MFKSRPSGGMLGSVGAKIAHASTITALGNPDLRTLQDLITAEKGVLFSVQRLAADVGKSAEALKTWGLGEGDDLGDVLTHSNNLLAQFSAALTQFASYEEQVRSQLKSVRSREEGLDEMKRRKRNVDHKADAADKKLAKMGPEHKGRQAQVELLNDLKEEGRKLDIDIMNEEAAIGDYKRRTTREFLALKFAAMVELAEKTTIIGDLGKLMIEEIPLHTTPPGHPRALYSGREKTSELSSEAMRCLSEIRLNLPTMPESAPATTTFEPYRHTNDSSAPMSASEYGQATYGSGAPGSQGFYNEFGESHRPAGSSGFSAGSLRIGDDGSRIGNTGGSQFHTLPASGGGFQDRLAPITLRDDGPQETFSSSVADALSRDPAFSNPSSAPTPPPHQPTAPVGTYAPPLGPPPGALQPTLSHSYFTGILPDPTQPSSPLVPPHAFSATSPWDSAPSSPNLSRPLPDRPQSQVDEARTDLAYARDPSPVPPSPQPPVNRELPPEPAQQPPSHNLVGHEPASPLPNQAQARISHELPNPYADALDDYYTTPAPAHPPVREQSPPRGPEQEEHVAAREVNRGAETTPMAPYSPPPRLESFGQSSPTLAPASSYGPTPGSTYAPPTGSPYGPPSSSPYPPAPIQDSTSTPNEGSTYATPSEHPNPFASPLPRPPTLPPLSSVPAISSPPPMSPGGRTISAGAFRRNVSRSDTLDPGMSVPPPVSPLSVRKKTLGEDTSRGPSPAPISPGAPPMYSAIDNVALDGRGRSMSPTGARAHGDAKDASRSDLV